MGATDPAKADAGTLRREFAQSIERNATHGSDAPEAAAFEIGYFFAGIDLICLNTTVLFLCVHRVLCGEKHSG